MTTKELEVLKNQLESEMLISSEKVYLTNDRRSFLKCYYIDYEQFVNVVRYRVYLMQKMMVSILVDDMGCWFMIYIVIEI
jgi:hypothetical protein